MTIYIIHGFMHGRAAHMPATWPDNTLRSVKPALVLNTAGKPQATLARATTNQLRIDPKKTVEQQAAAAVRSSQINRPAKASKKVAK